MTSLPALLEELKALGEKATSRPWQTRFMHRMFVRVRESPGDLAFNTDGSNDWNDCEFFVALVNALPEIDKGVTDMAGDRDQLHDLAKKIGNALMSFTPGGSEYFVKVAGDYYADAEVCQRVIRERLDQHQRLTADAIRDKKAAEASLAKLRAEMDEAVRERDENRRLYADAMALAREHQDAAQREWNRAEALSRKGDQ